MRNHVIKVLMEKGQEMQPIVSNTMNDVRITTTYCTSINATTTSIAMKATICAVYATKW